MQNSNQVKSASKKCCTIERDLLFIKLLKNQSSSKKINWVDFAMELSEMMKIQSLGQVFTAKQCYKKWLKIRQKKAASKELTLEQEKLLICLLVSGKGWKQMSKNNFPEISAANLKNIFHCLMRKCWRILKLYHFEGEYIDFLDEKSDYMAVQTKYFLTSSLLKYHHNKIQIIKFFNILIERVKSYKAIKKAQLKTLSSEADTQKQFFQKVFIQQEFEKLKTVYDLIQHPNTPSASAKSNSEEKDNFSHPFYEKNIFFLGEKTRTNLEELQSLEVQDKFIELHELKQQENILDMFFDNQEEWSREAHNYL